MSGQIFAFDRNDLLVYYPFNGDSRDYSGNELHASGRAATLTTDRAGNPNSAYFFNGDDILRTSGLFNYDWGDQLTVSVWFNRQGQTNNYQGIINNGLSTNGSFEIRMGRENGGTSIFGRYNSRGGVTQGMGFNDVFAPLNQWNHAVITYDGSLAKFYLNGQLIETSTNASGDLRIQRTSLVIGQAGTGSSSEYFYGAIDDVLIYKRALTDTEVTDLYQADAQAGFLINAGEAKIYNLGETATLDATASSDSDGNVITYQWDFTRQPTGSNPILNNPNSATPSFVTDRDGVYQLELTASNGFITLTDLVEVHVLPQIDKNGLVAWYPFNLSADDYSGNGYHGVNNGASFAFDRNSNIRGALSFDGTDKVVVNGLRNFSWGDQFTSTVWFRRITQLDRYQGVVNQGYFDDGSFEIRVGRENNGTSIFGRVQGEQGISGGIGFNEGFTVRSQWNHAALTYDGTSTKFYLNGELLEESNIGYGPLKVRNTPVTIGQAGIQASNTEFFNGYIDDVRLYQRALSQSEIQEIIDGPDYSSDTDSDGIVDSEDNCPSDVNPDQRDTDDDNQGDVCDLDIDGDSLDNDSDNCPLLANSDQLDSDSDGLGDACDDDRDGDLIVNITDNCPDIVNNDQLDFDADSIGDVCDADMDNDTFENTLDCAPLDADINPGVTEIINNGSDENCNPNDDSALQIADVIKAVINSLDISAFKNASWPGKFENRLDKVVSQIDKALSKNRDEAKLRILGRAENRLTKKLINKSNGCAVTGEPDNDDKIVDCGAQQQVEPLLNDFLNAIRILQTQG